MDDSEFSVEEKHKKMAEIQHLINGVLAEINEASELAYEPYIIMSKEFQNAYDTTRNALGITGLNKLEAEHLNDWIEANIAPAPISKHPHIKDSGELSIRRFWSAIDSAMSGMNVPDNWRMYFANYVITGTPPDESHITTRRKLIEVKSIDKNSVTIKFNTGIHHEEYAKTWNAITKHLGKGRRRATRPNPETRIRDLQMHGKKQTGYSNSKLAEEYFTTGKEYAEDAVKKAVKRQKKMFDEGIDLTQ